MTGLLVATALVAAEKGAGLAMMMIGQAFNTAGR
jgi:hypothetical protein